jgi:hypothetical protein
MTKTTHDPLILPLQFFAEPTAAEPTTDPAAEPATEPAAAEPAASKSFSQSELDAAISRAVEAHSKKKEKEFQKLLEKAKEDGVVKGKSYADLTEEQRKERDLEERMAALETKEREINTRERKAAITADLAQMELPTDLADILVQETSDAKVKTAVAAVKKAFDEAVNAKVKASLRQPDPKTGGSGAGKAKTAAERIAEARNQQEKNQGFDPWATK